MEDRPNILYKYRCWNNPFDINQYQRRILTHNEIYFASPNQFNDPFDCAIPFRYIESELTKENLFIKLYKTLKNICPNMNEAELIEFCHKRIDSGAFEDGEYWKDNQAEFIKSVNDKFGIYSLSKEYDNLLMWSHYADSHQGFCIGLDTKILYNNVPLLAQVIYDPNNKYPEIGLFDESIESFIRLFITKSKCWSYENEYRFIYLDHSKYSLKIENECIKQIFLGCKMQPEVQEEILQIFNSKFTNTEIYKSEMNNNEFKLDFKRIQ